MIKPQSTTLYQAYEPLMYLERVMFIDASNVGYLQSSMPTSDEHEWFEMFLWDHEHVEVSVMTRGFISVHAARAALFFVLWGVKMTLRTSCITDLMTEGDYSIMCGALRGNNG